MKKVDYYEQVQVAALYDDAADAAAAAGLDLEADEIVELCLIKLESMDPIGDDWSDSLEEFAERHALVSA